LKHIGRACGRATLAVYICNHVSRRPCQDADARTDESALESLKGYGKSQLFAARFLCAQNFNSADFKGASAA